MVTPVIDEGQLELAGLIHDLRNPLTAIHGYAQVLRLSLDGDGEAPVASVERAVSGILISATRMTAMLEDMLASSRTSIGGDSTSSSLAAILDLAIDQVEQATGQRRVHLVQSGRPITGAWDGVKV